MIFSAFQKFGLLGILGPPTMVSVLLCASVERCFVSRMRDFFSTNLAFFKVLRFLGIFVESLIFNFLDFSDYLFDTNLNLNKPKKNA